MLHSHCIEPFFSKVFSETIANALEYYGNSASSETQKFVHLMDKFFDCLNVRNLTEYIKKRKPNLEPYTDASDPRFKVSFHYCFHKAIIIKLITVAQGRFPELF